jgi:phthiodiolone/phenolphthiodiolone dimycocerosates ketoreductase
VITLGLAAISNPPWKQVQRTVTAARRVLKLDTVWAVDHFLGFFPKSIWDKDFSWTAEPGSSPDLYFDYQVLLGALAKQAGPVRLAVGVTEPIRRHPVLIAQSFMTLSHMTQRAPILGIGSGERENIVPYGLDFSTPVGVLEEALQIIRMCFDSTGPFSFTGKHFNLDQAVMDLKPAKDRTPEIWIAAHGPRMLRLTGEYGDGWYPTFPYTPETYAESLGVIRRSAESAGRTLTDFTPGLQMLAVIARTQAEARKILDHRSIRFTALLAPDYLWQTRGYTHPLGEGFGGMIDFVPHHYERSELLAAIEKVPVDLLADSITWGTVDDVETAIRDLGETGLQHVVLSPAAGLVSRQDLLYNLRAIRTLSKRLRS